MAKRETNVLVKEGPMKNDPILGITPKARPFKSPGNPSVTMWYCDMDEGLPSQKLRDGYYLVHNHVRPVRPLALNGFRAWVQDSAYNLVECDCSFGRNRNAKVNPHYCVRGWYRGDPPQRSNSGGAPPR